ncbi:MAG: DUF5320 domain-containing protein [Spirochaetales bacterium]|nr:DUF5320 domain-containing protein [Spirochaetales bacterium]
MRGNRMGPDEMGPKTGRGMGYCNGNDQPGFMSDATPMGMRRGFGAFRGRGFAGRGFGGRGFGYRAYGYAPSADQEILARLERLEAAIGKQNQAEETDN